MVEVNEVLHTECYDTALPADGGCPARCASAPAPARSRRPSSCTGTTALGADVSATLDAGMSHMTGAQMLGQYILAEYHDER